MIPTPIYKGLYMFYFSQEIRSMSGEIKIPTTFESEVQVGSLHTNMVDKNDYTELNITIESSGSKHDKRVIKILNSLEKTTEPFNFDLKGSQVETSVSVFWSFRGENHREDCIEVIRNVNNLVASINKKYIVVKK